MPVYRLKSDILGIDFGVESQQELTERDYFDILKTKVSPQKMLRAYKNNKDDEKVQALATKALDNNYFEGADFGTGFSEGAKSFGRGVKNMFVTNIYGTSRLLDATMQYGEADESQKYDELVEEGIKKAGQQLKGLSYASKRTDRTIEDDLSQALQFAGLSEDDENLKKRVIAEARRQDNSQAEATRAQMGVDAVGMMSMLGAKLFQGLGDAKDIATGEVSFGGDSKKRKLRQLDYLIEQDYIGRTIERGAELGLQLGGAISTISQIYTGMDLSPFEKNEEALRDVKSGLVKPDRDVAMLGSMFADPGMGATVLASGGLAFGRNFIARGAIIKTGQKAAQESALKSTIAQLSEIANPTNTQKTLLKTAEKNLAKVTGSGEKLEKLVAKAEGIAQAEAGKLLQKGQGNTPMAARLFQAIDKAPPPKAPFSNRMTGKILEKAGISAEYLGRTIEFLQRLPEETLGTLFMRSGMDEQAAMTASRATARTLQGTAAAGVVTGGFNEFSPELENLGLALLLAPGGSSLVTRFGHDAAILGKQLQYAQTSSPLFQRIAQLDPADSSLTAVTLDRTSALTIPGTISGLAEGIFAKSRQFGPSPALKAPATALTRTGLGNTLTGAVNATKTAVGASAIPGAIGYAVDGEAGAGGAIAASIPFIAAGLGFGTLARYGSQADVRAKMLGDQAYYKDTYLTDTEVGMYDSLAKPVRQAIATSVIQNPDVVYRFQNDRGNSHWSVENGESVVTIFTKSAPQEQLSAVLGHEIAHHIDAFGFMPQILEQLVGSVEKNQPGLFTEYKNGKPVIIKDAEGRDVYATNKEFAKHRQRYLDLLEQSGIDKNSPDYQAYANNDARIAREIFASHGAAWYFGGDFVTRNYQGAGAKMMGAILDPLFSSPGLRKFFHRIGLATQETTGLVADPLRLFPELKEIPALTRMIEKYNDDVRGFGPQARREGRGRGNLVDPEFADEIATASLTAKDLENPAIVNRLKAGGVVKIKDDGSIETDASGKPVFLPSREVNKKNKQLSQDILQIIRKKEDAGETFGEGHVSMEKTADGKERASGRFIDPSIIDELAKTGKYNPHQLAALKQISQTLRNNTGDVWNLFYYSALKWNKAGRKVYGQIKGGDRKSLPFGIEITKDGNINIQTISVDAFKKNLEWFAKSKGYEKKMSEAFGGMNAWENTQNAYKLLPTYLQNHIKGIINGTPESGITPLQRDLINAAIGRVNADQVKANPILEGLGDRRSQRQQSIRSRRLDRIGNAIRGESGFPAFKSAIEQNKVPMYMPAAYHGTPHTFAPEPGAPFGKFRTSAIGTGEGAQAYGHGLYFAGKKDVAEHYRKTLARIENPNKWKEKPGIESFDQEVGFILDDAAIMSKNNAEFLKDLETLETQATSGEYEYSPTEVSHIKKAVSLVKSGDVELAKGSLYKVELAPKENEYLLWDKDFFDQSEFIQDILHENGMTIGSDTGMYTGEQIYKSLAWDHKSDKRSSEILREAGIRGIKYLDGSSRNQATSKITPPSQTVSGKYMVKGDDYNSKGKHFDTKAEAEKYLQEQLDKLDYNYVIFDEADVQITDKLFMPASEAGAGKGKQAEAAKLWQEKGTDSPYFKKWFGKSKVVDENGEPLVVYHGTPEGGFSEFDLSKSGKSGDPGLRGKGFYFADSKYLAERYKDAPRNTKQEQAGQVYEVYLNIKNPYDAKANPLKVNFSNPEQSTKILKDKGFDGVIFKYGTGAKEIVAFSPEQIKSATGNRGTFDAGERNILFMPAGGDKLTATHNLSAEALAKADELGGLPVPSVGITKGRALEGFGEVTLLGTRPLVDPELGVPAFGSDVYSKRFPREKYKPVNTKLADSFIAKYKPFENETGGHELSIIFDALVNSPDLSDAKHRFVTSELAKMAFLKSKGKTIRVPKTRQPVDGIIDKQLVNEVNSLKNTPRIPSDPEYKLYSDYLRKAFDRREKKLAEFETNKERSQRLREKELNNLFDENGLVRMGVGDRLLYDIGRFDNLVVDKSKLRDRLEKKFTKKLKAEYEQWATQEIASLFDNPYILLDGKKVPLTLETATDSMKGRIRAVEKNMTFGPGEARSVASPRISSIQEMRNRSDSIVPKDEFETYKETIQEPVHKEFRDAAFDAFDYESAWMAFDNAYAALASYFRSSRGTQIQRMKSALRQFGFKPNEILVEKAIKAAEVLRDAPTEYFEAKPQRAVKLEEFAGAIIPKKANPKIKELADKYGWEVKTYDPNKPETRQTAVRQLANRLQRQGKEVLFMPSATKAPKRQPANRITRQAPAMPGNRFMLPAASAGAKSAERFR